MNVKVQRTITASVLALLVIVGVIYLVARAGGDNLAETKKTSTPSDENVLLFTFGTRGGLCPESRSCETANKVYADGRVSNGLFLSKQAMPLIKSLTAQLEAENYAKIDTSDCGNSTSDGSDPYLSLPKAKVTLETCMPLPTNDANALRELQILTSAISSNVDS